MEFGILGLNKIMQQGNAAYIQGRNQQILHKWQLTKACKLTDMFLGGREGSGRLVVGLASRS